MDIQHLGKFKYNSLTQGFCHRIFSKRVIMWLLFLFRFGICESALKSSRYAGKSMQTFGENDEGGKGKIYDGSFTNEALKWTPRYESFDKFMSES